MTFGERRNQGYAKRASLTSPLKFDVTEPLHVVITSSMSATSRAR